MSIRTGGLLTGATVSATGGTAAAFSILSTAVNSVKAFFGGTTYLTRNEVDFRVTQAVPVSGKEGIFTQRKNRIFIKFPRTLADGSLHYDTGELKLACHVEATDAEIDEYRAVLAQCSIDSDLDAYYHDGSLD